MIKKKKKFIKKKKNMLRNIPLNFYSPEVNLENANQHIYTAGEAYRFSSQTL
jgi:hypothetical protein